jgi:5-formyltetrahydrofolate cyclo-ligase
VPDKYRDTAAKQAATVFSGLDFVKSCENIACYLSFKHEFPTFALIEMIWREKKRCYVPVLSPDEKVKELDFVLYEYGMSMRFNRFGILEPKDHTHKISAQMLNLVIVPLLAFDRQGHRLGTGGGFYDTTFSFVANQAIQKPKLIGLGYADQQAESIPADPWDIKLEGIITEKCYVKIPTDLKQ